MMPMWVLPNEVGLFGNEEMGPVEKTPRGCAEVLLEEW